MQIDFIKKEMSYKTPFIIVKMIIKKAQKKQ